MTDRSQIDIVLNEKCIWEGIGIIIFPDGSTYHGQTQNGLFNGKGRMTHANGDIYQGEWKDGKQNGKGSMFNAAGEITFEGDFADGISVHNEKDEEPDDNIPSFNP